MRTYDLSGQIGKIVAALIISLTAGCILTERQLETDTLADCLVSGYCEDCVLIKIAKSRYVKSTINGQQDVLLVVDGVVEATSKQTEEKLPLGISVRHVELVDDEDMKRQLLDKLKESNSIPVEPCCIYAFFSEVSPPDGCSNMPIEGCIYPLMACWIGSEFYNPAIQMDEQTIIRAYRRRVKMQ